MPYLTPLTAVAGATLSSVSWNTTVRDSIIATAKPPMCNIKRVTSQAIPNNVITSISFSTENTDTDNMWSLADPTKIFAPVNGIYLATFNAAFTIGGGVTARQLMINHSTSGIQALFPSVGNAVWYVGGAISGTFTMLANSFVQFNAFQLSGGSLDIDIAVPIVASLTLMHYT